MDFGSIIGDVLGNRSGDTPGDPNQQHTIATSLMQMITNHGGVGAITDQLRNHGLGQQVDSWVGTGQNQPVDPQQVQQGLGQEKVQELAQKAGISPGMASTIAAAVLPMIIDRLTPNGRVEQGGGGIGGILGKLAG
jgi:uncharacterized protein YidB (DUF937 family)